MNRRQKQVKRGGGYTRPSAPIQNEWLVPVYRQRPFKVRAKGLVWNKWEYGQSRFRDAAWERCRKASAARLLELGGVTVEAEAIYDFHYEDYGEIVSREPLARRWLDYVPLVGSREYRVANGDDYPSRYVAYFVPDWAFDDRLDYYRRSGMPRHDAWECARTDVLEAAHKHLRNDATEISVTVCVDGEEYLHTVAWTEEYLDTSDPQDVLEFVTKIEGLDWIIRKVETERSELAAGQVGPLQRGE